MSAADVEVKVAVHMRDNAISEVTLAINNIPCVGEWGCDALVPRILPRGYTLTIHGSGGFHAVYRGEASP
ncbi:SCP1.201-like deaminase [Actinokineospora diospyrosa]|uniref:SCP1.201-like deaminase n=1 Tax=Actinokineospora diospyrosa TaxID=103728 RepID=A0ABT1IKY3_9PSEU|nr:SCP1.201-like deaminase [Actinokineospora diospyrosa]